MRRIQGLVLTGISLALTLPAAAETASQVFRQASPSVVVVVTYDAAGKPAELGSGVMLPNHDVATNCHVLKDGTQYRVRYRDKDYPAQLDKSDWDHDVCSLRVPSLPAPPVVLGNTKTLQVGAQVYAIGAPEGLQLTLSEGIVSSLRPVGGGSYIQTTAAISPGSSGGGLFDDQGHLLGLTSFYMAQGQQLNFALPVEWIEALPQRSTERVAQRAGEMDWLNRAVALATKKDWRGLVRWSQAWIKAWPGTALPWGNLGYAYDSAGQYAEAIDAYRQAVQINPQDAYDWGNLAKAYNDAGRYADATDAYRQAVQINPQSVADWGNLGIAYDHTGQYAEAIDAYRHALQINPQYAITWYNLGVAYNDAGQHAEAINAFRQALQISRQDADTWNNLGSAYDDVGQHAEAIDAYRQALQINPQYAGAWYNLGIDYDDAGQYAQAIGAYRQALQISPRDAETWNNLGVAYNDAGQYAEAINAYRQALQINPKNAKTWFGLGLVYNETGQNAQALVAYQQLKSLSPELAQELFDTIAPK